MSEVQDVPQEVPCIDKECIDCPSHVIIGGKLDCNYMNRLGVSKVDMKQFISDVKVTSQQAAEDTTDYTEELEGQLKQIREAQEKQRQKILEAQKQQTNPTNLDGGESSGNSGSI